MLAARASGVYVRDIRLLVLMTEPLLQDKHADHAEFRRFAFQLLQLVHETTLGAALNETTTINKLWRASVVQQTRIRFDEGELLRLIQDHLRSKGLAETAQMLEDEARAHEYACFVPQPALSHV